MRKIVDVPPVWLGVFVALVWLQADRIPFGPDGGAILDMLGGLLVGGGIILMGMAVVVMRQANTTVLPHQAPQSLVTQGIFGWSRNPIYLGDALILAGLSLFWSAWSGVLLVPLFVWLITDRFILGEEERLHEAFPNQTEDYFARVRRWV